MTVSHRLLHRPLLVMLLTLVTLAGCGGSTPQPKAPKMIKSPPAPTNPNAASNPPAHAPASQATGTDKQAKASKSTSPRVDPDPFPDEDPRNLFVISDEAANAKIGSNADALAINGFTVGEIIPATNSTHFEIAEIPGEQPTTGGSTSQSAARNAQFELPEGFADVSSFGYSEQGLPLRIRGEKSGALMALIPAGPAQIGSTGGPPETQPEFSPFLEAYYLDVTEVTLEQYQRFRDDVKQKKNSNAQPALNDRKDPNLPALGLPWGIALGFARWADKELPTEAELEHAARGPHGWRTPWGDGRAVWPKARDTELIAPVASFPTDQSIYGIFDLAGNAREWCSDYYSPTAHEEAASAQSRTLRNWTGPKKGLPGQRAVKGNGPDWSAWHRQGRVGTERHPDVGFRCVLRVKVPQPGEAKGD